MTAMSEDARKRGKPGNRLFTQENSQRVTGGEGGWGLGNPVMGRKTGVCPDEHQVRVAVRNHYLVNLKLILRHMLTNWNLNKSLNEI